MSAGSGRKPGTWPPGVLGKFEFVNEGNIPHINKKK
jgi:hypothetical protein